MIVMVLLLSYLETICDKHQCDINRNVSLTRKYEVMLYHIILTVLDLDIKSYDINV